MFQYFWSYRSDLPAGTGTANFSMIHFAWLAAALLLIVGTTLAYRRLDANKRLRFQKFVVILIAVLETGRWLWATVIGHYSVIDMLPLHLCSITVWTGLLAVYKGWPILKEYGYALGMPGALASMLTPDWGVYPFLSFQYLQAALGHTLLVLVPVLWVWGDGFRPSWRRLPGLFGLLLLFAAPVAIINRLIGSNYLFICGAPKDTPLELFQNWFGNPGYLVPLIGLIFVVWALLYLPWAIIGRIRREAMPKKRFAFH